MNCTHVLGSIGFLAAALAVMSCRAGLTAPAASQTPDYTIRYVCFVAIPKEPLTPEEVAKSSAASSSDQEVTIFDELNSGSPRTMDTTPTGFLNKLRAADSSDTFQILLSGSVPCMNGDSQPARIAVGPVPGTSYRPVLSAAIFLAKNSSTTLVLHHTGQFTYTSDPSSRGGPGWIDMHTDKIQIGRVYTQGVDFASDGRKVAYAFCVLPGKWAKAASASAWHQKSVKMSGAVRSAGPSLTARRVAR